MNQQGTKQGKTEKLSTYVEPDIKEQLEALAEVHHRTVAGELRLAVIRHLEAERDA
jgi:hypothetical protein